MLPEQLSSQLLIQLWSSVAVHLPRLLEWLASHPCQILVYQPSLHWAVPLVFVVVEAAVVVVAAAFVLVVFVVSYHFFVVCSPFPVADFLIAHYRDQLLFLLWYLTTSVAEFLLSYLY